VTDRYDWQIQGADGERILGTSFVPDRPVGSMLIAHGFKGYKDYGFIPRLAEAVAARGVITHRFNFSHSGMTESTDSFARPDLFERDTWSRQVFDVLAVHEAIVTGQLPGEATRETGRVPVEAEPAPRPVFWFGHSRGGVSIVLAARDLSERRGRETDRGASAPPEGLILAAAPSTSCSLSDADRDKLRRQGYLESPSSRTGQRLRVGSAWLAEIEADPERHDPLRAVASLAGRGDGSGLSMLIVHGESDGTVPPDAARAYAEAAGPRARLQLIPAASHTFDCPNPAPAPADLPEATRELIDAVIGYVSPRR